MQCQKLKTYMETGRVVFLPAKSIQPNPAQPRRIFRPEELQELAQSIRVHGVLQPLSVRRLGLSYELIAGERRLRAAVMAGLTEIPCIVMTMDRQESALAALVENLQRRDLDFVEEAQGISRLLELYSLSQEQAARLLGKSQSAVANKLRLLRHSPQVLTLLLEKGLTERHARALLKLSGEPEKCAAIELIARRQLSVQDTERYIDALLQPQKPRPSGWKLSGFLGKLESSLEKVRSNGFSAVTERRETEDSVVLTITISKPAPCAGKEPSPAD